MEPELDMNLLVTLDALLQEGTVTAAAERLGVSQSALSHRLRNLREQLDDPLMVPAGRRLVPTERAEALRPVLRSALQQLRDAVAQPAPFDPTTSQRRFVIVSSDFGEFVSVPGLLERVKRETPGLSFHFMPPTPRVAALLASGDADLAIGPPLEGPGLVQRVLPPDPFVLVVRADHPGIRRKPTRRQYLAADHLLVAPRGAPTSAVDAELRKHGAERRVALIVAHFTVAPFIVAESDLAWTAQRSLAEAGARYVPLRILPHPFELPVFRAAMTWHERTHHDPGHQWLREMVSSVAECG